MLAEENIEEYVPMPSSTKGDFLLRVKGESMIDAGILDGDLVIVQKAQTARNGAVTSPEPELPKVRTASAADAGSCVPSGLRASSTGGERSSKNGNSNSSKRTA